MLKEVGEVGKNQEYGDAIIEKASLLIYKMASGQYFHEGNKRTALVAGLAFLRMNGYSLDIRDEEFVLVLDRAGISTANLNDVRKTIRRLVRNVRQGT